MNRDRIIIVGLLVLMLSGIITGDSPEAFAIGMFVGGVGGIVFGVAWVWNEPRHGRSEEDAVG